MTKEQNENIDKYIKILEDSIGNQKELQNVTKELNRVRKLIEDNNRTNFDEHHQFREQFKIVKDFIQEYNFDDQRKKERCLRTTQDIYDLIEEKNSELKNNIEEIQKRNIVVELWKSVIRFVKEERKHIAFWTLLITAIFGLWEVLKEVSKYLLNLIR